ncbi:predicted protein [Methanosarcina acetivorans C2A]|uniref:Uncharacterized protein n=2 Tax=Methanosarcina acetivorans TaxID=2214 RepID=Q8TLK6_METAC|nr:predicted protein [Methanosarcina acetivorans C2A]
MKQDLKGILMSEIREVDRFECRVISVIQNLAWKGVTVEEKDTKGRVYFGRVSGEIEINPGDTFYLGVRPLYEIEDKTMRVTLYDAEDKKLDWILV